VKTAAPHLFTLTCNLLAERTLTFGTWARGKTQRATGETFQVGGKGINVSKMANRLGISNTALCFTGGAPGAECETWLRAQRISFRAFGTDHPTRTGTVVRSDTQPETTFLGPDVQPSAAAVAACSEFLDAQPDGQLLAICGSVPGWTSAGFDSLRAALERWLQRGLLAADTYGPPLEWFAQRPLALVKINATELRTLITDRVSASLRDVLTAAPARWPVQRWVVTDGPAAVWFCDRRHPPACLKPPLVREISPTGSGDVLHASLLKSLFFEKLSLADAITRALPLASANAAHPGIAEFSLDGK